MGRDWGDSVPRTQDFEGAVLKVVELALQGPEGRIHCGDAGGDPLRLKVCTRSSLIFDALPHNRLCLAWLDNQAVK